MKTKHIEENHFRKINNLINYLIILLLFCTTAYSQTVDSNKYKGGLGDGHDSGVTSADIDLSGIDIGLNSAPALTDIDGDGLLDMLIGMSNGQISHHEQISAGSGIFTYITDDFNSIDIGAYSAPAIVDLDGDGLLDLLIGKNTGEITHYEQSSDRSASFTWRTGSFNSIDVGARSTPAFTDLDNDGLLDLLVGESDGTLNHYEQNAAQSTAFTLVTSNYSGLRVDWYSAPCLGDLDNDNILDLLPGNISGVIHHFEKTGSDPNPFVEVTSDFESIDVGEYSTPALTDLDGDGKINMVTGEDEGIINFWEASSAELNLSAVTTATASSITSTSAVLGGEVTDDNEVPVVRRGVCYGTTNPPTLADTQEPNGSGVSSFSETVSGLSPSTTYYVRAFCTSQYGTFYGPVESFTTGGLQLSVKVFLEGAYNDAADAMTINLAGSIPATSPYADSRNAGTIPAGITDWVYLQLRSTSDGAAVYSRSYLLRSNGFLAENDGSDTNLAISGLANGDYFIVIKHRNHLAIMSKTAQSLSGTLVTYDFTVKASAPYDKYFGDEAADLETDVYGMFGGDVNQNGEITTEDYTAWYNDARTGASGYNSCDINLDSEVTTADYTQWYNNARIGASSNVPNL